MSISILLGKIVGKGIAPAVYDLIYRKKYGMSARQLVKHRLKIIIEEYDKHHCATDRMAEQFHEGDSTEDLFFLAAIGGLCPMSILSFARTLVGDQIGIGKGNFPLDGIETEFSNTIDQILHHQYYLNEEGRKIPDVELKKFINVIRGKLWRI